MIELSQREKYKPIQGFIDLREYKMSKHDFKRFWNIQKFLFKQGKNKAYLKEFHPTEWQKLQWLSGEYQASLFRCERLKTHQQQLTFDF